MNTKYDVVVIGGGVAGVSAAIAVRRSGASVLLIEKNMVLGGVLTSALVNPMMTFNSPVRQVTDGIGQEIINRLKKIKGTYGHIKDPIGFVESITPFEPEKLKTVLISFLRDEKVDYLLGCLVNNVDVFDGYLNKIEIVSTGFKVDIQAKIFIDATGDGNICIKAGSSYSIGNGNAESCQPMTLVMRLRNIDRQEIIDYIKKNPGEFVFSKETQFDYLAVSGFFKQMKKTKEYGLNFKRDRLLFFEVPYRSDEVFMNTTRYDGYANDPGELTSAQSSANLDVFNFVEFLNKEIPGFQSAELIQTGCSIGIRETTHVKGDYRINTDDLLNKRKFEDTIAIGAYPVDIHLPSSENLKTIKIPYPGEYEIPLRALIPENLNNVLLAGRNISAQHTAFSAIRTSPLASSTGQVAGICASLALKNNGEIRKVKYEELKNIILKSGGIL
ncbi:MAG: hypothetical protein PWQ77_1838 [Kosmotogales bacterium]|nr:hypothetical protein [Kosmotogales bacterium]